MQPIAQIDLGRAGELLGADFGRGLAQVWTRVTRSVDELDAIQIAVYGEFEKGILLRIIPEIDLLNEPIDDFPDFAPWLTQRLSATDTERPGLLFAPLKEMEATPIIRWKKVGQMFYYVDMNIPMESFLEENDPNEESEDSSELTLRFRETANSVFAGPMTNGSLFLGGTGGASGADDPAFRCKLVFNIQDSEEMNISLVFDESKWIRPSLIDEVNSHVVSFHREKKLRAVFSLPSKNW